MSEENKCCIDRTNDLVRKEYKRYKKRKPPPDFSEVIDFNNPIKFHDYITPVKLDIPENTGCFEYCSVGLDHPSKWNVFELKICPGFLVVTNPFLSYNAQSYWMKKALTDYTKDPYPCNLDILMKLDRQKGLWEISHEKTHDNYFINQLRWVHLGYHFDYNVVDYKAKKYFGMPPDLKKLTETIARSFNFKDYAAETGIINYYPEGSSMGGHTDHYEEELRQPLISYSFGQSAVYLIGGDTRDIKPEAIWVRSGDIMLMTGPSRTAFHAVPCILTKPVTTGPPDIGSCPLIVHKDKPMEMLDDRKQCKTCTSNDVNAYEWKDEMNSHDWHDFSMYISNTRININIRQVHKYNKES